MGKIKVIKSFFTSKKDRKISDRPGVRFQPGPGSNFLARAGGTDSGRGRGRDFWSRFGAQSDLLKL